MPSWTRRIAIGLGSIALMAAARPAAAGPAPSALAGVLDGSGAMHEQSWQTAYLMAEGSAEAKVVGPLNRGAKLEIDPVKSTDQYWFVHVPDSPGGNWQGFVWKDFVRVTTPGAPAPTAASSPRMTPMTETLAQHQPSRKAESANDWGPAEASVDAAASPRPEAQTDLRSEGETHADATPAEASSSPAEAELVPPPAHPRRAPSRPRVELEHAGPPTTRDSSLVAYDPELFEVHDASGVHAISDAPPKTQLIPPSPSELAPLPPAPARVSETDLASPVRQIQALREEIERELEAAPLTALTPGAAQSVDALVTRLNDVLKLEKSMAQFLESTGKMVEAHDQEIHELQVRLTTMTAKGGPDRAALSEEIARLRRRIDDLSSAATSVRQHASRLDALEARLGRGAPRAERDSDIPSRIAPEHGAIAIPPARKKKSRGERLIEEGVVEVTAPAKDDDDDAKEEAKPAKKAKAPVSDDDDIAIPPAAPAAAPAAPPAKPPPGGALPSSLRVGLQDTGVASMLAKLRELREQRHRENEAKKAAAAPEPKNLEQKASGEPAEESKAVIIDGDTPPDDMRDDDSPRKGEKIITEHM